MSNENSKDPIDPMDLDNPDSIPTGANVEKGYVNSPDEDEKANERFNKLMEERVSPIETESTPEEQEQQAPQKNQVNRRSLQPDDSITSQTSGLNMCVDDSANKIRSLEARVHEYETLVRAIVGENDKLTSTSEIIKYMNNLEDKVKDYEAIVGIIVGENDKLTTANEFNNYASQCGTMIERHKKDIQELRNKLMEREKHIEHCYNLVSNLRNDNGILRERADNYKRAHDSMSRDLENIKNINEALQREAAEYQSRLGDAKNYRLGDDDRNNSTRLTQDIEELQNNINTYARVKRGVELDLEMARRGLLEFGCTIESATNPDEVEDNKMLIKALLQRVVLRTIIDETNEYLRGTNYGYDEMRELEIFNKSGELINKARDFSICRVGTDEVSHVAPTKIRQQIFALLGDRGFSDIQGKNGPIKHPFVVKVARIMDQQINRYRVFKSEEKKKEYDELAPNIIREVIKIFYFRCKVQEPEAEYKWIEKGEKIDSTIMQGFWDDQIDQWSVDLCYFPLIGINLKNEKNRKVLYAARVLAVKEKERIITKTFSYLKSSASSIVAKVSGGVTNTKSDYKNASQYDSDSQYDPRNPTASQYDSASQYPRDYEDRNSGENHHGNKHTGKNNNKQTGTKYPPGDKHIGASNYQSSGTYTGASDYQSNNTYTGDRLTETNKNTGTSESYGPPVKHSNVNPVKSMYDIVYTEPLSAISSKSSSSYAAAAKNSGKPERSNSSPVPSDLRNNNTRKSSSSNIQTGDINCDNGLSNEGHRIPSRNQSKRSSRDNNFLEDAANKF